ncbi:MAG: redoxin family protein [Rhizobiales bacterium]|nr:redoxin family protein [Hyphomicrobiales bacterium]
MTETSSRQSTPKIAMLIAVVVVLAVAGVYLIIGQMGNGGDKSATRLTPDEQLSESLRSFAVGEMAKFTPTQGTPLVPDIAFEDGEGKVLHMTDFKGKTVLLNLWATWCGPCREEMPALDALQARLGSDDFEVVALSTDSKGLELARSFHQETGIKNLRLFNEPTSKASFVYKAFGLPTTILISPDGHELGRLVGPAHWDTAEAEALINAATKTR